MKNHPGWHAIFVAIVIAALSLLGIWPQRLNTAVLMPVIHAQPLAQATIATPLIAHPRHLPELTATLQTVRKQALVDTKQFQDLLAAATNQGIMDYEYAGPLSEGDLTKRLATAKTRDDWQFVEDEAQMLLVTLQAMLQNLHDPTPFNQPHATDRTLLDVFGAAHGKVIVISLREQSLRAYEDGSFFLASLVTTGRPDRPSPPGLTRVSDRRSPTIFRSDEPPDSPLWFAPTPINYALQYYVGGYYIHDAWWRTSFGPGTNLPHYDPIAFNGGSHGCVNLPKDTMKQLYDWSEFGMPVIIY